MKPLHILLLLLVVAIWGINFVFVKIALDEFPPLFLCFLRFFFLSIPAIFFIKRPPAGSFKMVALYSLVMFVLQFALIFTGMTLGVSPGLASILLQTQVFFSILFASLILKEKVNSWQLLGAFISFSGVCLVAAKLGGNASLLGFLFVLAAAATWGGGSVIVKKMGTISTASLIVWSSLLAWPPLLLLSLLVENSYPLILDFHHLEIQTYSALSFIILGSTAFGFGVWNRLLHFYPLATMAPFTLLVPIFGLLSSAFFLNEPLQLWKISAGILVLAGLCVNLLSRRILQRT